MQLGVTHVTGYQYEGVVTTSYNEARMTPATGPGQLVLSTRLDVTPDPWTYRYRDYWGSMVTAFEVTDPHDELLLRATSSIQVDRHPAEPQGLGWEDLLDPDVADQLCDYLVLPARVAPDEELAARVAAIRAGSASPGEFAHEIVRLVHGEVGYVVGSTHVHTLAADAWADRRGVCQDMAHLCIGALRSVGVPARYVSGYLHPRSEPTVGETVTGESHAWIEWWDGAWIGFDPTNEVVPDDRYVVVGSGRDYTDVAPLAGIFSGGKTSSLFVEVSLTRTA
jgi:transglutaminase-like putative cysteine protease